jgi:hypothetical protein
MNNNLQTFFNQIEKLELVEVPDDEYYYVPTQYAVDRTKSLLTKLDNYMGITFPGYASLESRGGIYIIWEIENLGCVYYRVGIDVDTEDSVYWENYVSDEDWLLKSPKLSKVAELLKELFWEEYYNTSCHKDVGKSRPAKTIRNIKNEIRY